jgi:hypothetical protein
MKSARLLALLLLPWLVGCASTPVKHGVADADPLRRAIVEDVVEAMSGAYAPSLTALALTHAADGAFENALHAALRAKGYTVSPVGGRGVAFNCSVDAMGDTMYRVNVRVGTSTLSRLWVLKGNDAYAGGAWSRRE